MERDDGEGWWRGMTNLLSIKLLLDSATVVESSRSRSLVRWLEGGGGGAGDGEEKVIGEGGEAPEEKRRWR